MVVHCFVGSGCKDTVNELLVKTRRLEGGGEVGDGSGVVLVGLGGLLGRPCPSSPWGMGGGTCSCGVRNCGSWGGVLILVRFFACLLGDSKSGAWFLSCLSPTPGDLSMSMDASDFLLGVIIPGDWSGSWFCETMVSLVVSCSTNVAGSVCVEGSDMVLVQKALKG